MHLRFHTPSFINTSEEDSTRLQEVIARAIERAVATLGSQNGQIEFVGEETPDAEDLAAQYRLSISEQEGEHQQRSAPLDRVNPRYGSRVSYASGQTRDVGIDSASSGSSQLRKAYPAAHKQTGARPEFASHSSQRVKGNKPVQVRTRTGLSSVIRTPDGDTIEQSMFPEIAVIQGRGDTIIYAGGSPYVKAINLARALQWGATLFKDSGYVVLQPREASGSSPFYVARLLNATALSGIGDGTMGSGKAPIAAQSMPLRDYVTVAVVNNDGQTYVANGPADVWNAGQLRQTLESIPRNQRTTDAITIQKVSNELGSQFMPPSVFDGSIDIIVDMDRTLFAAMPWEKRAEYLVLLVNAWTSEREEFAILEIIYATRNTSELEALFALLREYDGYQRLFGEPGILNEQRYALLQMLGDFVVAGPLDWRYLVDELFDTGIVPTLSPSVQNAPEEELSRAASTLQGRLIRAQGTAGQLLGGTGAIGQVTEVLAELLWIIELTRFGNTRAQSLITEAVLQAEEVTRALRGLRYAEEVGTPYNQRGEGSGGNTALAEGLRAILLIEVLSSLINTSEISQALKQGKDITSHLAALTTVLSAMGQPELEPAISKKAQGNAADLERLLLILASSTQTAGKASVRQLIAVLPDEYLVVLEQINELLNLPEDADIDLLRRLLKDSTDLLHAVDVLVDILDVVGSFVLHTSSLGGVTTAMLMGVHALMQHTTWTGAMQKDLFESVPIANQAEFYSTITFINPNHLLAWNVQVFKELTLQPRALAFIREAGSDVTATLFERSGRSWPRLVMFLDQLAIQRTRIANPIAYRSFLDRLGRGDDIAFHEVEALVE